METYYKQYNKRKPAGGGGEPLRSTGEKNPRLLCSQEVSGPIGAVDDSVFSVLRRCAVHNNMNDL